jgi:hypothetical protein
MRNGSVDEIRQPDHWVSDEVAIRRVRVRLERAQDV